MKTKDHRAVSLFLLRSCRYPIRKIEQIAFLAGSVEPDYNPVTYLRGFLTKQRLRGHNYENAHDCISHLITRIGQEELGACKRYYLLGKLMHYVADAFTYPHNRTFPGSLSQHCMYEGTLHSYMSLSLDYYRTDWKLPCISMDLMTEIEQLHQAYMLEQPGYMTDCYYIMKVAVMVFAYIEEEYAACLDERIA